MNPAFWGIFGVVIAAIVAGTFAWINRRPDRLEQVSDGAWKLKEDAEKRLSDALLRIAVLEATARETTAKLIALELKHIADMQAAQVLCEAALAAERLTREAALVLKDRTIVRLTEQIGALEGRIDALVPLPPSTTGVNLT